MRVIATINASTTMPMHVPLPTPSPMPAKTNPATIANARDLRNPLRLLPSLQDQDSRTRELASSIKILGCLARVLRAMLLREEGGNPVRQASRAEYVCRSRGKARQGRVFWDRRRRGG